MIQSARNVEKDTKALEEFEAYAKLMVEDIKDLSLKLPIPVWMRPVNTATNYKAMQTRFRITGLMEFLKETEFRLGQEKVDIAQLEARLNVLNLE
jgi:hypothetical protein